MLPKCLFESEEALTIRTVGGVFNIQVPLYCCNDSIWNSVWYVGSCSSTIIQPTALLEYFDKCILILYCRTSIIWTLLYYHFHHKSLNTLIEHTLPYLEPKYSNRAISRTVWMIKGSDNLLRMGSEGWTQPLLTTVGTSLHCGIDKGNPGHMVEGQGACFAN